MRLLLQELSGADLSSIEVEATISLADLRSATRASLSLDQTITFSLVLGERELHENLDDLSLADLGVEDNVIAVVVKRLAVLVLTASADWSAKLFNSSTGDCLQTFVGHRGVVNSAASSADGSKVLTASDDGTAKIFSSSTGDCLQTLAGHSGIVSSAAFSADGSKVVTASEDGKAKVFNSFTGDCLQTLAGHFDAVMSAVFSADG